MAAARTIGIRYLLLPIIFTYDLFVCLFFMMTIMLLSTHKTKRCLRSDCPLKRGPPHGQAQGFPWQPSQPGVKEPRTFSQRKATTTRCRAGLINVRHTLVPGNTFQQQHTLLTRYLNDFAKVKLSPHTCKRHLLCIALSPCHCLAYRRDLAAYYCIR